jgi:HAMP domain-containing protein
MRQSQLAGRLTFLVAIFAVLFLVFGFTTWRTLEQVRVKGPIYNEIILGKDLIADVLPPPEYIIESYLLVLQEAEETDTSRIAQLVERGERLRLDYESRQEFWRRELAPDELKDFMTVAAAKSATEFFRIRDEQFVPALRAGDRERARALIPIMNRHYEAHRLAIDQVVAISTKRNAEHEKEADAVIAERQRTLVLLAVLILLVVGGMAVYAVRTGRNLSSRIQLAADVAHRVAGGDLATEVPTSDSNDEAGRLLKAIAGMTQSLRGLVTRA